MNKILSTNAFSGSLCVPCVQAKRNAVHQWLYELEQEHTPIYSSVDIRDAGFKIAVIDTNLFPAGFNNLCEHGLSDGVVLIKNAILKRVTNAQKILIVTEDHTRNPGYLEHTQVLQSLIHKAGFETTTAMLKEIPENVNDYDLLIMNNDLTTGIPDSLKQARPPIFPSIHAGWHARHKSRHFHYSNQLIATFADIVGIDPWQFSCLFTSVNDIDVHSEKDRQRLYAASIKLLSEIQSKYQQHNIEDKPFLFIKSDTGTYGLGVIPIEDPQQILDLNRRKRNDLMRGKGGETAHHFLLQEGVPTIHHIEESPCEASIYQIDNNLVGGFCRYHTRKTSRENLNSPGGMTFQKICPHLDKYGKDCRIQHHFNIFDIYRILARIAGVAAGMEIKELESRL